MKKIIVAVSLFILMTQGMSFSSQVPIVEEEAKEVTSGPKKRVLYVDSYHRGYKWSDGITRGVLLEFNATLNKDDSVDSSLSSVELKILRMDTKRNQSSSYMQNAALKVKKVIEQWEPDVVIASDDNASKYLVIPYYKNADIPFVFCGINWDAGVYGYPYKNTTGMVEVGLVVDLVGRLKLIAKGERIGFLGPDVISARKDLRFLKNRSEIEFSKELFARSVEQWQEGYLELQKNVDILFLSGRYGIPNWNEAEMKKFVENNTRIPSGSMDDFMAAYSLICFSKESEEQGAWAAKAAKRILAGESPSNIPIVTNKKSMIYLNMRLARKLGITFSEQLKKDAIVIGDE